MQPESSINLLNVLTPIVPGQEVALAEDLASLPHDLFARVPGVHVARWVRLGRFDAEPVRKLRPSRMEYLLFTAVFNGPVFRFLDQVVLNVGSEVDTIWRHCVDYPCHTQSTKFHQYLERNSITIQQHFIAYQATVREVLAALTLREQHIKFAVAAETLSDIQLQQAFCSKHWSHA
jgi:hypothetical protein